MNGSIVPWRSSSRVDVAIRPLFMAVRARARSRARLCADPPLNGCAAARAPVRPLRPYCAGGAGRPNGCARRRPDSDEAVRTRRWSRRSGRTSAIVTWMFASRPVWARISSATASGIGDGVGVVEVTVVVARPGRERDGDRRSRRPPARTLSANGSAAPRRERSPAAERDGGVAAAISRFSSVCARLSGDRTYSVAACDARLDELCETAHGSCWLGYVRLVPSQERR